MNLTLRQLLILSILTLPALAVDPVVTHPVPVKPASSPPPRQVSPTMSPHTAPSTSASIHPPTDDLIRCANLIYAGTKSSVCFSDKFLDSVRNETSIRPDKKFTPVKLATREIYDFPFAIMNGEGAFTLLEPERKNLRSYLLRGGFLLASAGCSSPDWDRCFRKEVKQVMPDLQMKKIPMDHPIFRTLYNIPTIPLKHNGTALLEGLELDGRIILIYSQEGLNDTPNVKGCCCCGGNEIRNSREVNANIFTYVLTH